MDRFQRGKVYKIISPNTDRIYIGSTTEKSLACRMAHHRCMHGRWKAGGRKDYSSSDMIEFGGAEIVLIESWACNNKDELRAREQHHLDINAEICVNARRANTPLEERNAHRAAIIVCACGARHTRSNTGLHSRSAGHQRYLAGGPVIVPRIKGVQTICDCGVMHVLGAIYAHVKSNHHLAYLAGLEAAAQVEAQ